MKIASIKKFIFFILIILLKLTSLFICKRKKDKINVVFFTGKLGDDVCLTPFFENLKKYLVNEKLFFIGHGPFADILNHNPYIDKKITFGSPRIKESLTWFLKTFFYLNKFQINYYFNLMPDFNGAVLGLALSSRHRHTIDLYFIGKSQKIINSFYKKHNFEYNQRLKDFYLEILEKSGVPIITNKNRLYFPEKRISYIESFFKQNNLSDNKLIIGVTVNSGKSFKEWPASYWVELINKLIKEKNAKIVFFGSQREVEITNQLVNEINEKTYKILNASIKDLPYYLKRCDLFVSVDTGLLYIADAIKVPVVAIMGTCDETQQGPENNYSLVTNPKSCIKFMRTPLDPSFRLRSKEVEECFKSITPEMVLEQCEKILKI